MRHCVAGLDVGTITANANVFRRWYSDEQNDVAAALLHRDGSVQLSARSSLGRSRRRQGSKKKNVPAGLREVRLRARSPKLRPAPTQREGEA